MMKIAKHTILMAFIFISIACGSKAAQLDMVDKLPIYTGAHEVDKRKIGSPSNQQLFYKIKDAYPSSSALDYYDKHFADNGWKKCAGTMEEWSSFIDAAQKDELLVHHITHYWVKESDRKLAIVFLRYNSKWPNESDTPDNDAQNVFVLMQKDIDDLNTELARLSVKCRSIKE
jgi:hypothetical protein